MQMRADLQLRSALRALREVVMPAIDADNPLALEQLQIVIGMLQMLAVQLPLQYRYDHDELTRLVRLCDALNVDSSSALAQASAAASDTLARAMADPAELLVAIRRLRVLSGEAVTAAYRDGSAQEKACISRLVLEHADQQLLRERAWVAAQGWEAQPARLPAIETLFGDSAAQNPI